MFATAKRIGVTATSELHEIAAKKGVTVEFKFLEPYNFEFKHRYRAVLIRSACLCPRSWCIRIVASILPIKF
jgi:hypothetical protein